MKTNYILSALIALLSITFFSTNAAAVTKDCGTYKGVTRPYSLIIKNTSASPIVLRVPATALNCTQYKGTANPSAVDGRTLASGESATFTFALIQSQNLAGYVSFNVLSGGALAGSVGFNAYIVANYLGVALAGPVEKLSAGNARTATRKISTGNPKLKAIFGFRGSSATLTIADGG